MTAVVVPALGVLAPGVGGEALANASYAQSGCLPAGEPGAPAAASWALQLLAPERAWPFATGAGQRVAVVGTGVADTPYLAGQIAGRVDLAPPPESGEPSGEVDCLGIGTGTAGVIATPRDAVAGFHGIAPDAVILDAKVVGDRFPTDREAATVSPEVIADAIEWAVDEAATVVAVGVMTFQDSDGLREAVATALGAGVVVVASVGEAGSAGDGVPVATATPGPVAPEHLSALVPYPAAYPGVIGVGSLTAAGTAGASHPTEHVDLVAPGVDVLIPYPGDGLGPGSSSGLAAGQVAGAAALLREHQPDLAPEEVAHRLFATAVPAPEAPGGDWYGYGIVDPYRALVERVVEGEPVMPAPYQPVPVDAAAQARAAAAIRGEDLAGRLAFAVLGAMVVTVAAVAFGARARQRRWRAGLAAPTADRPDSDDPEPPRDLFDQPTPPP